MCKAGTMQDYNEQEEKMVEVETSSEVVGSLSTIVTLSPSPKTVTVPAPVPVPTPVTTNKRLANEKEEKIVQGKSSSEVVVSFSNLNDNKTSTQRTLPPATRNNTILVGEVKTVQGITQESPKLAASLSTLNENETSTKATLPPVISTKPTLPPDVTV